MGWGAKKNCMDPIVLKRIKNLLKNAIFVQFLIPSAVNWLYYMHITWLPGLGCFLHHSGGVLARIVDGFSLAGSTHGEVYVTLTFALALMQVVALMVRCMLR